MRPKALTALFLATLCLTPGLARAAKPVTEIPVKVTIHDSYGAAVTSDSGGDYIHGINGVRARIMTATGDLLINFDTDARRIRMNWSALYNVTSAVTAYCGSPPEAPQTWPSIEPFSTGPAVSFNSIGLLDPEASSMTMGVVFNTQYGIARLKHRVNPQNDYCAGYLKVTRSDDGKSWEIESQSNLTPTSANHDGIAVILQEFTVSQRPYRTELRPVRYLNLPFKITVTLLP